MQAVGTVTAGGCIKAHSSMGAAHSSMGAAHSSFAAGKKVRLLFSNDPYPDAVPADVWCAVFRRWPRQWRMEHLSRPHC